MYLETSADGKVSGSRKSPCCNVTVQQLMCLQRQHLYLESRGIERELAGKMTQSNRIFLGTQAKTLAFAMVQVFVLPPNSYVEIPGPM